MEMLPSIASIRHDEDNELTTRWSKLEAVSRERDRRMAFVVFANDRAMEDLELSDHIVPLHKLTMCLLAYRPMDCGTSHLWAHLLRHQGYRRMPSLGYGKNDVIRSIDLSLPPEPTQVMFESSEHRLKAPVTGPYAIRSTRDGFVDLCVGHTASGQRGVAYRIPRSALRGREYGAKVVLQDDLPASLGAVNDLSSIAPEIEAGTLLGEVVHGSPRILQAVMEDGQYRLAESSPTTLTPDSRYAHEILEVASRMPDYVPVRFDLNNEATAPQILLEFDPRTLVELPKAPMFSVSRQLLSDAAAMANAGALQIVSHYSGIVLRISDDEEGAKHIRLSSGFGQTIPAYASVDVAVGQEVYPGTPLARVVAGDWSAGTIGRMQERDQLILLGSFLVNVSRPSSRRGFLYTPWSYVRGCEVSASRSRQQPLWFVDMSNIVDYYDPRVNGWVIVGMTTPGRDYCNVVSWGGLRLYLPTRANGYAKRTMEHSGVREPRTPAPVTGGQSGSVAVAKRSKRKRSRKPVSAVSAVETITATVSEPDVVTIAYNDECESESLVAVVADQFAEIPEEVRAPRTVRTMRTIRVKLSTKARAALSRYFE